MNKFEHYSRRLMWFMAFLMSTFLAGCGGGDAGRDPILGTGAGAVLAPTVIAVAPDRNATLVPINTKIITVNFSKAMDPATLTPASFTLACPGGMPVTGTVSYVAAGNVATLTLPAATNLPLSTLCTATVTTAAKDSTGTPLDSNFFWTFTTGTGVAITAPRVIATSAYGATGTTSGATGLPINRNSTATFSKAMDPTMICGPANLTAACPAATFTLTCVAPCTSPTGVVTYLGTTATFNPNANLAANQPYTSTITTGTKDLAGNPLTVNYVWTWATGAATDTTAPTVTLTNPANSATNVPVGTTIKATFSKEMKPATVTSSFTVRETVSSNNVPGTFTFGVAPNYNVTFTPLANLTSSTDYTVTITNGATDLAANALVAGAVANPWTFKTAASGAPIHLGPAPVNLGAAASYGVLAGTAVTLEGGPNSVTGPRVVLGDVGESPGVTCTGCDTTTVPDGVILLGAAADAAKIALVSGYDDAIGRTLNVCTLATSDLTTGPTAACNSGLNGTFYPGLYWSGTSISIPAGGTITLDAQNDPTAVFIFQSESTVGSLANSHIVLAGQAQAKNVFWVAKSSATIGGIGADFAGTVIALSSVTVNTNTHMLGRALARNGQVTVGGTAVITVSH